MDKRLAIVALDLVLAHVAANGAEWLSAGGNPQRTGWQQREKLLNTANVHLLKLLWKRQLDNQSLGLNSLTSPTMLGPIITHRGIKELVLIAGSSDTLYAVDADLGRIFWKKHFDADAAPCNAGLTAAPAIAPASGPRPEDDEGSTPLRPVYVLTSDGQLHTIRPSDGAELNAPVKFVPPKTLASSLNFAGKFIYTSSINAPTAPGCGEAREGLWSIDVSRPGTNPRFSQEPKVAGFAIGAAGKVYSASTGTPVIFEWRGRELRAAVDRGRLLLKEGNSEIVSRAVSREDFTGGLASWADAAGARWVYATSRDGIAAFRLTGTLAHARMAQIWTSPDMPAPLQPAIANGIIFVLSSGAHSNHAILHAVDAMTGKRLYSSGNEITSPVISSGLAVANGHICFGANDNTLYCFGIPMEI